MEVNKIYKGDSLTVLKTFPDKSVDMCMTSPPYWALRDYNVEGQLGLVALKNNRKFVGIELSEEYIEIANKRLKPYLTQTKIGEY